MYNITGAQAIRETAKKYGLNHTNTFYIKQVQKEYGLSVNQPQIVQTIGAAKARHLTVEANVFNKARALIEACQHDLSLAITALKILTMR